MRTVRTHALTGGTPFLSFDSAALFASAQNAKRRKSSVEKRRCII